MGGIVSGIFGNEGAEEQAEAAEHAAELQAEAAKIGAQTQREMFDVAMELGEPYRNRGQNALAALSYELGLGPSPEFTYAPSLIEPADIEPLADQPLTTGPSPQPAGYALGGGGGGFGMGGMNRGLGPGRHLVPNGEGEWGVRFDFDDYQRDMREARQNQSAPAPAPTPEPVAAEPPETFAYQGFQETPGYQFNLDQGQKAINRSLAASGGLLSGAAVKAGQRFSQGLADQTYSNYLARLAAMAGLGGGFAVSGGTNAINTGRGVANTLTTGAARQGDFLTQAGNARASGYAALGRGLGQGINALASFAGGF